MTEQDYDYSKRGPCCDYHLRLKAKYEGRLRGLFTITGGLPRYAHQICDIMIRQGVPEHLLAFALSERCWCHDHPNPPFFRRFMGKLLEAKERGNLPESIDDRLELLGQLAEATLTEAEKK